MKEVEIYYLRKEVKSANGVVNNVPYAAVAVKWNGDGTVNRGVSICSTADKFVKSVGTKKALARMNACEKAKKDLFVLNKYDGEQSKEKMPKFDLFDRMGYYKAKPTEMEHRMFNKPE